MDLFNIGGPELLVLVLIGLLLFGPEDVVKISRKLGGYLRSAQRMWADLRSAVEIDLMEEEATTRRQDEKPLRKSRPAATQAAGTSKTHEVDEAVIAPDSDVIETSESETPRALLPEEIAPVNVAPMETATREIAADQMAPSDTSPENDGRQTTDLP
ncbi:MAG: twin-arginine translocase TatA/TatE family subunit [Anaerolineae bacterium]|nr:twin-arginine translocase TatA/TatE family subunit [Anaerolineae bacterium]